MAETTSIAWCDSSWNPWIGCTKVGPGCDHCYAEVQDSRKRWGGTTHWGAGVPRYRTSPANWAQPLMWNRKAAASGKPWRVFCASLADVFDNEAPQAWRDDLWELICDTPHLEWLLVTKRIGNVRKMGGAMLLKTAPNTKLLITVCNQDEADRDIPKLLALPCKNGVSYEPALGPVYWKPFLGENNAIEEQRGHRLSSGAERRIGNRSGRTDLEGCVPQSEQVDRRDGGAAVQAPQSGERHRGISTDQGDVQQEEDTRTGAPFGLASFQRSDSRAIDRQPQGREEETECPEQFGTGDPCRTDHARDNGLGQRPEEKPRSISWVIVGGESGSKARTFNIEWARSTVEQCNAAGVPVFVKQLGARCMTDDGGYCEAAGGAWPANTRAHVGATMDAPRWIQFKDRAGADPAEWPEDLRVREFPV